jgi:hypothetical protein
MAHTLHNSQRAIRPVFIPTTMSDVDVTDIVSICQCMLIVIDCMHSFHFWADALDTGIDVTHGDITISSYP